MLKKHVKYSEYILILVFLGKDISLLLEFYIKRKEPKAIPSKVLHKLMEDCTKAVQHLMLLDIVHRDLKPQNFMWDPRCNFFKHQLLMLETHMQINLILNLWLQLPNTLHRNSGSKISKLIC